MSYKRRIKSLAASILYHLGRIKEFYLKRKAVWLFELPASYRVHHADILNISRHKNSLDTLLNGPIKPPAIPSCRSVSTQAPVTSHAYLYKLDYTILRGDFPLIYKDGLLLRDSVFFSEEHDRLGAQIRANFVLEAKNKALFFRKRECRAEISNAMLLFSRWNHYGHWVSEHLLKLKILCDALGELALNVNLILEKNPAAWKVKMLNALGWGSDKLVEWDARTARADNLYVPSYPSPNYDGFLWLKKNLAKGFSLNYNKNKRRKLYLSRNKLGYRCVKNEKELVEFLAAGEFEILYPETMTLEDQILAFAEASVIVGPHGSAFTNIIFAENAKVVEFFGQYVPLGFYCCAVAMGHEYHPLFCDAGSEKNDDMVVDIGELRRVLMTANQTKCGSELGSVLAPPVRVL